MASSSSRVWFCENLIPPKGAIEKKSRILHWMYIKLGDNVVTGALETGVVNVDVDLITMKDTNDLKDEPRHKMKDEKASTKKVRKRKHRERFLESLHQQESLVAELKRRVLVFEEEVTFEQARRRRPQDGGHNVPHEEPSISPGGITPGGISSGGNSQKGMSTSCPPMKTYVRMGSRRRYKSRALRIPYVGLLRINNE